MGYNTTITILNDALAEIKADPEGFVRNLTEAIARGQEVEIRAGNHVNAARVMRTAHADVDRLYYSQGNLTTDLSFDRLIERLDDRELALLYSRVKIAREMADRFYENVKFVVDERAREHSQSLSRE